MVVKQATDPSSAAFADALQTMSASQLRSQAMGDVANVGLASLGAGVAGRGLLGLVQMLRSNRQKKTRTGPAYLPLPYPASPEKAGGLAEILGAAGLATPALPAVAGILGGDRDRSIAERGTRAVARTTGAVGGGLAGSALGGLLGAITKKKPLAVAGGLAGGALGLGKGDDWVGKPVADFVTTDKARLAPKQAGFLSGDMATTKGGIPWYGPAMLMTGLAGAGAGWAGMDKVLQARRKKQMESDLEGARSQFREALLNQYDTPVQTHPGLMGDTKKAASDGTMVEVGRRLDALYEKVAAAVVAEEAEPLHKVAFDASNVAGQAAGGYGMYAGLSGLLAGALVYDKMSKRSRRSVLEGALKRRQRRQFMQQPTEIFARPEPVAVPPTAPSLE